MGSGLGCSSTPLAAPWVRTDRRGAGEEAGVGVGLLL